MVSQPDSTALSLSEGSSASPLGQKTQAEGLLSIVIRPAGGPAVELCIGPVEGPGGRLDHSASKPSVSQASASHAQLEIMIELGQKPGVKVYLRSSRRA